MAASRTIAVRLTLEEADQFRAALKAAGADGEAALKKISDASKKAGQDSDDLGRKVSLQKHEWTNLSFQLQDFAVQVGSGQGVFRPLLQQGPQAVGAVGGVKNAISLLTQVFTPLRVGALVAVGGVTALVVAAETADARLTKLRNSLVGYTSDYAALATRIEASSRKQAGQLGIGVADVRAGQSAVVQALPGLSDADVQKSIELGQKLALTIDHDIGTAMQHLGQIAKDPAAAIKALAEQGVPGLSASLVTQIDLLQRSGDRSGAYKLAVQSLLKTFSGAEMTEGQKATATLTGEWEKLWTGIEEGLAGPGKKFTSWLASNLHQIGEIRDKGGFMPPETVLPDWASRPLIGSSAPVTSNAEAFASTYGPPIGANAANRGLDPQVALALAGLESGFGKQTGGGANNPFNLTALPGQNSRAGVDNANGGTYNFRNFSSLGEATNAFVDLIQRKYPDVLTAGRDPVKIAAGLRVGEQGGYAEGVGGSVEERQARYARGLEGAMRRIGDTTSAPPPSIPSAPYAPSGRDRRDIEGPAPNAPNQLSPDYIKQAEAARSTLEGRRQGLTADIAGTQTALATATATGDQDAITNLNGRLRDQRAELEKLRDPVSEYVKGLHDQADAAKSSSGASGEVGKALADLNRIGKDSGWQVSEGQKAEVISLTLARLSADYRKTGEEITRTTKLSLDQAHGWDASNDAGRLAEAQQKAYADAIKVDREGTPAFVAALNDRTNARLKEAEAAKAASAASRLLGDRTSAETLNTQIALAERGTGADDTARELAALQAKQSLDGVSDPQTRAAVMSSSKNVEELRLKYQSITVNTNELSNFASSAFDKIGDDITSAFTQGTSAAEAFGNIGKAVISEVLQEMIKLSLINPLKNALLGTDSSLPTAAGVFGKLFGGTSTAATAAAPSAFDAAWSVPVAHSGALIGSEAPSTRMLHPSVFHGATRYHTGGIASDEVPAVLKAGEGVFTPGQMKALGAGMGGGGASIQADFHYHAAPGGDGKVPSNDELERASKAWSREQEANVMAIIARERGRPGGMLWR